MMKHVSIEFNVYYQINNDYYEKDNMQFAPFTPVGSRCTDFI